MSKKQNNSCVVVKKQQLTDDLQRVDKYGNNVDFPDSILSDMTIKGVLGKWTTHIAHTVLWTVSKYYVSGPRNIDCGDMSFVKSVFCDTNHEIDMITPILEDLVNKKIYGMEDIFISVFGVESDEVYVLRKFYSLFSKITEWDSDYMWNDCSNDTQLKEILDLY